MDLDALLHHYFGTTELDRLDPATIADGCERARLALGLEAEPGRRFALWMLLQALDAAPEPSAVFKDAKARRIAEDYARAAARAAEDYARAAARATAG